MQGRFDAKPKIAIIVFSIALSAMLIFVDSQRSSGEVETRALGTPDETADRVAARQLGSQAVGREAISPQLSGPTIATEFGAPLVGETRETGQRGEPSSESLATNGTDTATSSPATDELSQADSSPTTQSSQGDAATPSPGSTAAPTTAAPATPASRPTVTSTTSTTTTTRVPPQTATTTTGPSAVNGSYTVAQVIAGTISAGDGSNPNEEAPMGRHDAPLYLPQGWNWAQGPTRNGNWGNLGAGQFVEWRCAVIPEYGHTPPVPFRVNVRNGAYYQFANDSWSKAFDVALDSKDHGAYLGQAGQLNADPFSAGGHGQIDWRQEADGSYSAPWNSSALMMHFWAGARQSPASGQTAEFLTSEIRLQQPDGQQVDLSQVRVLFQCGLDYYSTTGGQGTRVPGPGIATYQLATASWKPGLWVTLPNGSSAESTADFRRWLEANLPPDVEP